MGASMETKLQAMADLEAGDDVASVAKRYGVSRGAIYGWKKAWDAGELDDAAKDEEPDESEPDEGDDEPDRSAGLVLKSGESLPPPPPQAPGVGRRVFPDAFKYTVAHALLTRQTTASAVAEHYGVSASMLYHWTEAVRKEELKKPGGSVAKGRNAGAAREKRTEPSAELVPYAGAAPNGSYAGAPHPAQVLAELEHLRRENRRLKRQLERALEMVLDRDDVDAVATAHG